MRSSSNLGQAITRARYDAVLFDLDGVITDTANLHAACWKQMFDDYLKTRAVRTGEEFRPFDLATDYLLYVDGKPRFDGVRDFLSHAAFRFQKERLTTRSRPRLWVGSETARMIL
jgi:beta-phosphoglucomutase-like phosphatase (HAD superfamily)